MNELTNDISSFTNVNFGDVRVLTDENGVSWFFGTDVCRALEYARPRKTISQNVDKEDIRVFKNGVLYLVAHTKRDPGYTIDTVPNDMQESAEYTKRGPAPSKGTVPNRMQDNTAYLVINESGLYQLVLRSRKPEAQAFMRWVTDAVLPRDNIKEE